MEPRVVEHATTDEDDNAAITVNISASNVVPVSRDTGRPRGCGRGRSMCAIGS